MKLEQLEKKIKKEFAMAEKEVKKKATEYFKQFELADKQMKKDLGRNLITSTEYKEWRKVQLLQGKAYKELEKSLAENYYNARKIAVRMINENTPISYFENVNFATYEIEKKTGINTMFTLYDEDTVKGLLVDDPDLLPKAKLPKGIKKWETSKINSALLQGVLAGDNIDKIADRLRAVTNSGLASSIRTARTLTTACENRGRIDAYHRAEEMGIELEKVWMATEDNRTRHSHALIDGEVVGIDEEFSNGLQYPADPEGDPSEVYNCRCTMETRIKKIGKSLIEEQRDFELQTMTFERWKNDR